MGTRFFTSFRMTTKGIRMTMYWIQYFINTLKNVCRKDVQDISYETVVFISFHRDCVMPTLFYTILFWIYWLLAAGMGCMLAAAVVRERDRGVQATAAMLLVPVILRVLLIK